MLQTILGANGVIAKELAKELRQYTDKIRLVSRNPLKVSEADELFPADLTDSTATSKAIEGSAIVYLVVGIVYKTKAWQQQWPVMMQNVIAGCKQHGAKLVFFDNVYMYEANSLADIKETNPVNPSSKKGAVRAAIAQMILDEISKGSLTAMIVRAADFYGPGVANSIIGEAVYKNLKKGKKAMWLADATKVHSCTYVPDAAKATALLGNTPDAYGEIWHLPTDDQRLTGKEWVHLFAETMQVPAKYSTMSKGSIKFLGFFISFLGETHEMLYQYDRDYFFNSEKFKARFPQFKVTSYNEGVQQTVQAN